MSDIWNPDDESGSWVTLEKNGDKFFVHSSNAWKIIAETVDPDDTCIVFQVQNGVGKKLVIHASRADL